VKPEFRTHAARDLYEAIDAAYHSSPSEQALLVEAMKSLDRAEQAREAVGAELTVFARGGEPKAHPLLLVERDARAAFARLMRQLGLDDEPSAAPLQATGSISSFPRGRAKR
jgi:hypothetical protein